MIGFISFGAGILVGMVLTVFLIASAKKEEYDRKKKAASDNERWRAM